MRGMTALQQVGGRNTMKRLLLTLFAIFLLCSSVDASWTFNPHTGKLDYHVGPTSSTDHAVVRWDGTTGRIAQDSTMILDDTGNISGIGNITIPTTKWLGLGATGSRIQFDTDAIRLSIGATEQIRLEDGRLRPTIDNDVDLGSSETVADASYTGGASTRSFGSTTQRGQSFSTGASTTTIKTIAVRGRDSGGSNTITLELYEVDGSDLPIVLIGTATNAAWTNTPGYEWKYFTFASPIVVTSSTQYAFMLSSPDDGSTSDYDAEAGTGGYAGGINIYSTDGGSSFYDGSPWDLNFKVFATAYETTVYYKDFFLKGNLNVVDGTKIQGGYLLIGANASTTYMDGDGDVSIGGELRVEDKVSAVNGVQLLTSGTALFFSTVARGVDWANKAKMGWQTVGNDHLTLGLVVGAASGSGNLVICEYADVTTNFGHAANADSHLYIHSSDAASVNDYIGFWHDQTDGNIEVGAGSLNLLFTGNLGIGTSTFGTTAAGTIAMPLGTDPTADVVNQFAFWGKDLAVGNTVPYLRTENGTVIGLNQSLLTTDNVSFAELSITGLSLNIVAKTAAYTATTIDDVITCGAGNETFTVDLPVPVNKKVYYIKNVGTGLITVDANTTGSTTIDGQNTQQVVQFDTLMVIADASVYHII